MGGGGLGWCARCDACGAVWRGFLPGQPASQPAKHLLMSKAYSSIVTTYEQGLVIIHHYPAELLPICCPKSQPEVEVGRKEGEDKGQEPGA